MNFTEEKIRVAMFLNKGDFADFKEIAKEMGLAYASLNRIIMKDFVNKKKHGKTISIQLTY